MYTIISFIIAFRIEHRLHKRVSTQNTIECWFAWANLCRKRLVFRLFSPPWIEKKTEKNNNNTDWKSYDNGEKRKATFFIFWMRACANMHTHIKCFRATENYLLFALPSFCYYCFCFWYFFLFFSVCAIYYCLWWWFQCARCSKAVTHFQVSMR